MSFDEETTLNDDAVLDGIGDEETTEEEPLDPLAEVNSEEKEDEDEVDPEDEDELDAKLFGGVDDEDEGYNPMDEHNADDWS